MKLPIKSADVRLYKVRYSRFIFKTELVLILITFSSLFVYRAELWFLPTFFLTILLTYIYFSLYSVIRQWPDDLTLEIRHSTCRMIFHDQLKVTSYPVQKISIRMTRWFVILRVGESSDQQNLTFFKDSFDDMNHYTSFRRNLILLQREEKQYVS
jgi:hypothetical protein